MRKWLGLVALCGMAAQGQAQDQPAPAAAPPPPPRPAQTPPPPPPTCTRQSLQAAVDSYLDAQRAGDRTRMAFAEKVKYLQNMSEVDADKGLWNTALPIDFSRSFLDKNRCRTFSEVIVTGGEHPYVIGTRLSVDNGKITAIDSLVTEKGDWLFNANNYLKFSKVEDWHALSKTERVPMQQLIDSGNQYLDQFSDKLVQAPWGIPCARLEGGAYTDRKNDPKATCKVGIPPGVLYIVNRDYVVDEELGVVNIFCRFGNSQTGMPDSHTFRLVKGKLRWVHTLSVSAAKNAPQVQDY
jgi:hypothetical protein